MENITLKKMKSGAQQYARGNTSKDRLETIMGVQEGARRDEKKIQDDITYEEEDSVLQKKRAKRDKATKAYMSSVDAFMDEVDEPVGSDELAKEKETSKSKANRDRQPYAKGGMVKAKRSSKRGCGVATKGFGRAGGR